MSWVLCNGNRSINNQRVFDISQIFDERPWQCEIVDGINLEITFAYDEEDGWHHYCALVYAKDNNSFDLISGYGIDSKLNVIDTVMDICRDYK